MNKEDEKVRVLGARVHNLKNVDVEFPRNTLTVITGLSGSGKSSLAFDTIFAEGQRRYIETFSAYARNFLGNLERPDVDKITGLSPVIRIRGEANPKRFFRSLWMMDAVSIRPSMVMASDTAFRGRWVVASATRSIVWGRSLFCWSSPASIMTTRSVWVLSAKYSVWPVKGMLASLMMLFWTGAVVTASKVPSKAPSMAMSMNFRTAGAFLASSCPATGGTANGTSITMRLPERAVIFSLDRLLDGSLHINAP